MMDFVSLHMHYRNVEKTAFFCFLYLNVEFIYLNIKNAKKTLGRNFTGGPGPVKKRPSVEVEYL
jgi:hypothetical protein